MRIAIFLSLAWILSIGSVSSAPLIPPEPRGQCIDGTLQNFLSSKAVPVNSLEQNLPRVRYPNSIVNPKDESVKGRLEWEALPPDTKVKMERIATYRGQTIYRVCYDWNEDGGHCKGMLLAFGNAGDARPFFIAEEEQLADIEASIVSSVEYPFSLEARIFWKGNGVMTNEFTYLFDKRGPYLLEVSSSGRRSKTVTERYKGERIIQRSTAKDN